MTPTATTTPAAQGQPDPLAGVTVFVNPDALHTVPELRAALARANMALANEANNAEHYRRDLLQLAEAIAPLVLALTLNDVNALKLALRGFMSQHVRQMPATPSGGLTEH